MSEHTKLPWVIAESPPDNPSVVRLESRYAHGIDNDGWVIAELHGPQAKANAELILRALGNRKDLLTACKNSLSEMEKWRDEGCCCEPEGHTCGLSRLNHSIEQSEAAIKKGEPCKSNPTS